MKIELRAPGVTPHLGYWVEVDGQRWSITQPVVHALIRKGMQHQRERSAKTAEDQILHALAKFIRAQPISDQDILKALEGV